MKTCDAIKYEVGPFGVDQNEILWECEKLGLDAEAVAVKEQVAKVAINLLVKQLSFSSAANNGMSESYNEKGIRARISALARENQIEVADEFNAPIIDTYNDW